MKYDFRVGDYFENRTGLCGCVIRIDFLYDQDVFKKYLITVEFGNEGTISYAFTDDEAKQKFKRIGKYDFTEEDKDKIEHLNFTEKTIRKTSSGAILHAYMKKINELVDAVNELRMRDAKESKDDRVHQSCK